MKPDKWEQLSQNFYDFSKPSIKDGILSHVIPTLALAALNDVMAPSMTVTTMQVQSPMSLLFGS